MAVDNSIVNASDSLKDSLTKTKLIDLIVSFTNWILAALAVVAVVMVIYAGYLFIIGGANDKDIEKAKKILMYAVIGLIVAAVSYSVVSFVSSFF